MVKLVNNTLFAANIQLVAQAEQIANDLGVDTPTLARVIQESSGASYVMGLIAMMGSTRTRTMENVGRRVLRILLKYQHLHSGVGRVDGRMPTSTAVAHDHHVCFVIPLRRRLDRLAGKRAGDWAHAH